MHALITSLRKARCISVNVLQNVSTVTTGTPATGRHFSSSWCLLPWDNDGSHGKEDPIQVEIFRFLTRCSVKISNHYSTS